MSIVVKELQELEQKLLDGKIQRPRLSRHHELKRVRDSILRIQQIKYR